MRMVSREFRGIPGQGDVVAAGGVEMDGTLAPVEEGFRHRGTADVLQPIPPIARQGLLPRGNIRGRIIAVAACVWGGVDTAERLSRPARGTRARCQSVESPPT